MKQQRKVLPSEDASRTSAGKQVSDEPRMEPIRPHLRIVEREDPSARDDDLEELWDNVPV